MISFTSHGRMTAGPFVLAAIAIYAAGVLSQSILASAALGTGAVLLFIVAQLALIGGWIVIHRRRLHDAQRPAGMVIGIAAVYALDAVLLVLLTAFAGASEGVGPHAPVLDLFVLVTLMGALSAHAAGAAQWWIVAIVVVMLLPLVIAIGFSIWAATRPSALATA